MIIKEKTGVYMFIMIILILLGRVVFSEKGLLEYKALKNKEKNITIQIETLNETLWSLENEIHRLKTDMEYIKHVAKHEYDMAEENELIFKTQPTAKKDTP